MLRHTESDLKSLVAAATTQTCSHQVNDLQHSKSVCSDREAEYDRNLASTSSSSSQVSSFCVDYNLLEQLLDQAVPNSESRLAASALLQKFRTLGAVFAASDSQLLSVSHVTEPTVRLLRAIRSTMLQLTDPCAYHREPLQSWEKLTKWLRLRLGHETCEVFLVLFLDRENCLICDEEISRGTVDFVAVHTREIIRRALELGASYLLLAHNHPTGRLEPSWPDRRLTNEIATAARAMGMAVHDHVIVSFKGFCSFRENGLIEDV